MVAPTLFHYVAGSALAGSIAGQSVYLHRDLLGLGCGAYLLLFRLARFGAQALRPALLLVGAADAGSCDRRRSSACSRSWPACKQQALPHEVMESVFRDRFATWHGVASVLYLIECALGLGLVVCSTDAAASPDGRIGPRFESWRRGSSAREVLETCA